MHKYFELLLNVFSFYNYLKQLELFISLNFKSVSSSVMEMYFFALL